MWGSFKTLTYKKMATWNCSRWLSFCGSVLFILLHCFEVLILAEMRNSYCPCSMRIAPPERKGHFGILLMVSYGNNFFARYTP